MSLLVLSPAAFVISAVLLIKTDPNARVNLQLDRAEAIRTASRYAATLGINTEDWTSGARVVADNDRFFYYSLHRNNESEMARRLAPEVYLGVVFIAADWQESLNISLAPDGRLLGYSRTPPSDVEVADPGEPIARQLALDAFRALQQKEGFSVSSAPTQTEQRKSNSVTRGYVWHLPYPSLPGLDQQVAINVLGDKVIAQKVGNEFDPRYAAAHLINRRPSVKSPIALFVLLIFALACYGLYRYIRRSWQKEVPHTRSLLLGAVASCAYIFLALQSEFHLFELPIGSTLGGLYWTALMGAFMSFLVLGMALGLAYGSGEGDVREAYPGKLTSLDALLTGRFFSRNVARAVCIGCALGGWTLLVRSLILLPWTNRPGAGLGLSDHFYQVYFGHFAWLLPLLNPPLGAIQEAVTGLLLPLSFLLRRRRIRSEKVRIVILSLLSLISALLVFSEQPMPFLAGLLVATVQAAALLLLFFSFDLLTAIVGISIPKLVHFILYFTSQPAPALQRAGYAAASLALMFLFIEILFLIRGREYDEEEVRPIYARHLAERLRLEAEVSAAREAQVRLLPQRAPEIPGLSLAAACRPARVVGGDFYDLFVLDEKRLALFVAEGGGHGLGAALMIAYAKGFLMPRISAGLTPAEIVSGLQNQLAPLLETDQELSLAYAVINTSERTLSYARAGRYPQVKISRDGEVDGNRSRLKKSTVQRNDLHTVEQEIRTSMSLDTPSKSSLREATVTLAPGDVVIFVTDGIVKNIQAESKITMEEWASEVVSKEAKAHQSLQQALERALEKRARLTKKIGIEDDLTAILIRLEPAGATT